MENKLTTRFKLNLASTIVILIAVLHHVSLIKETRPLVTSLYIALFAATAYLKVNSVLHLTLLMALWYLISFLLPDSIPRLGFIYFAILFGLSVIGIRSFKDVKNPLSWFTKGDLSRVIWLWTVLISLASAAALIIWAFWSNNLGAGEQMLKGLTGIPKPVILFLGAPIFALLNAFSEEVIYRGVFQEAAERARFPALWVLVLQASGFASIHFSSGFPNGFIGYAMTFVYAIALGMLRLKTRGLLAPYVAHVCADLVIIYFLCFKFL